MKHACIHVQSIQGTWWLGVKYGETAHPAIASMGTWGSKCQLSMSHTAGEGLRMPTPSLVGHGTASCGLLAAVLTPLVHRCLSAGSLGRCDRACTAAESFTLLLLLLLCSAVCSIEYFVYLCLTDCVSR